MKDYSIYKSSHGFYYIAPSGTFEFFLCVMIKNIKVMIFYIIPDFLLPLNFGATRIFYILEDARKYKAEIERSGNVKQRHVKA